MADSDKQIQSESKGYCGIFVLDFLNTIKNGNTDIDKLTIYNNFLDTFD